MTIIEHLHHVRILGTDISGHLLRLRDLARECPIIVELGVRSIVSTWAFMEAKPKKLTSVDLVRPSKYGADIGEVYRLAKESNIDFQFIEANDLEIDIPAPINMLFIDTWHVYEQLKQELALYAPKTTRYIAMHDTVTFGTKGESKGHKGLNPAIDEFLVSPLGRPWKVFEKRHNSHGLTVLKHQ